MASFISGARAGIKYGNLLLLALIAAGLLGNYFHFLIFLDIDFLFGSIFAMLALQAFGLGRGIVAAALIASSTYLLWNEPYAMVILTAEVASVGWLMRRRRIGMVLADLLYWLFLGMPLAWFFYQVVIDVAPASTYIIMTKQAMNGLANALVARLIFVGVALRLRSSQTSFRELIYNLLALFVLGPALILLAINGRSDFAETDRSIRSSLHRNNLSATSHLDDWLKGRTAVIVNLTQAASVLGERPMQARLEQALTSDESFLRIGMRDAESKITAYAPALDETGQSNIGKRFAERPYIAKLRETLKPMLAEVVMARIGKREPVVILLAPVVKDGQFSGYVNGVLRLDEIRAHLERAVQGESLLYSLLDSRGNVILSNRKDQKMMSPFVRTKGALSAVDAEVSRWVPELPAGVPVSERWPNSFYVSQAGIGAFPEWQLILEQPVAPFQKALYDSYSGKLTLLFVVLLGALVLAEFLSRRIIATLDQLGKITRHLPLRMVTGDSDMVWPESGIRETTFLIDNFRMMTDLLMAQFDKVQQINETLEQRVLKRTTELQHSERRFRSLIDWSPEALAVHRDGVLIYANPATLEMFGAASANDIVGKTISDLVHPDVRQDLTARLMPAAEGEAARAPLEERFIRLDGAVIDVELRAISIDYDGAPATQVAMRDITERKRNHQRLERLIREQKAMLENDLIGIVRVANRTILWANPALEKMLGYRAGELVGTSTRRNYPDDRAFLDLALAADPVMAAGNIFRSQIEQVRKDGVRIWVDLSGAALDPQSGESMWVFLDVTEHKRIQEQVRQLAFLDPLTKLPNRRLIYDRLNQTMASSRRSGCYGALMFLDLDNFKPLNDSLGHGVGDLLLIEVSQRLRSCVREIDTIARIGGDEFVVMLNELDADMTRAAQQANVVAEKIRNSLAAPYFLTVVQEGRPDTMVEHRCTASIGVVLFRGNEAGQDDILKRADAAMYQAKAAGRNQVLFADPPA